MNFIKKYRNEGNSFRNMLDYAFIVVRNNQIKKKIGRNQYNDKSKDAKNDARGSQDELQRSHYRIVYSSRPCC